MLEDIRKRLKRINDITASNEFWALGSGDHLNMIDELAEDIDTTLSLIDKYKDVMRTAEICIITLKPWDTKEFEYKQKVLDEIKALEKE